MSTHDPYARKQDFAPPPAYGQPPMKHLATSAAPAGTWVYQLPSSKLRIASGVLAVLLGPWMFFTGSSVFAINGERGFLDGLTGFAPLVLSPVMLTAGIILLTRTRARDMVTPILVMTFASTALLAYVVMLFFPYILPIGLLSFPLALAAVIVTSVTLTREERIRKGRAPLPYPHTN